MSPFKSSAGRQLGKMLEGFKSSDVGKGFGSGAPTGPSIKATGGQVIDGKAATVNGSSYRYHYFKEPGSLIFPDRADFNGDVDVLVVGGGGSGGNRSGGGGGAGGVAVGTNIVFPGVGQLTIPITVGDGGPVASPNDSRGNTGSDSRFGVAPEPYSFNAVGGGYGGGDGNTSGGPGGSGGGGHYGNPGGSASQPSQNPGKTSFVTQYGYAGSAGHSSPEHNSGAGGGAGSAALGGGPNTRGAAGDGVSLPIWDVTYYMSEFDPYWPGISPLPGTYYGGGGGGGDYPPYISQRMPNNATYGGGGVGGPDNGPGHGTQGVDGLGGGGGGACGSSPGPKGGKGGNGIVVVRYRT